MASEKIHFVDAEKMRQGLAKIVELDPSMADEEYFFDYLLSQAGLETNVMITVLAVTSSIGYIMKPVRISLYRITEALLDDEETIRLAKESLDRIALHMEKGKAAH
jgi:hypothetical protein